MVQRAATPAVSCLVPLLLIYLAYASSKVVMQNVFTVGLVLVISTMLSSGVLTTLCWYRL